MAITQENWSYCCYINKNKKALITIGMSPENMEKLQYFVTVIQDDSQELFQQELEELSDAVQCINDKYSKVWKFQNLTLPEAKKGSCSTCIAH